MNTIVGGYFSKFSLWALDIRAPAMACYSWNETYLLMDINELTIGIRFSKTFCVRHNVHQWNGTAVVVAAAFFFMNSKEILVIYTVVIYNGGRDDTVPF